MTKLVGFICVLLCSSSGCLNPRLDRYEYEHLQMGTKFNLIIYADTEEDAQSASHDVFQELDKLNLIFSDYNSQSELSILSRTEKIGEWINVSEDMWKLLSISQNVSHQSNGAFDITIGPLSKLWRRAFRRQEMPDEKKIIEARSKVNYHALKIHDLEYKVMLLQPLMKMDAGGIAKGYAIDKMASLLKNNGISSYMIEGGGDIKIGNSPPNQKGWKIKLANGEILELSNTSIVTSGDTFQFLEWNGRKYSHLIDPRTGIGMTDSKLYTITSSSAAIADVWASTLSIMNEDETMAAKTKGYLDSINIILPLQ